MRTIIILLFLTLPAFPQMLQGIVGGKTPAATCSTPSQGNLLISEGFETATTGYERSGWGTATGTPDPYYDTTSLTTSKPNGGCNRGFESNHGATADYSVNAWDYGSASSSTVYFRGYLYLISENIQGSNAYIGGVFYTNPTHGYRVCGLALSKSGAQVQLYGNGATSSAVVNISTGQWYLVEMKCVPNGASAIKVNGGAEQTFTGTGYTTWRRVGIGNYGADSDTYSVNRIVWDLVATSSSGYIGATP